MRSRPGAAPARRRARAAAALGLVLLAGAGAGLVPPWLRAGGTAAAGESAAAEEAETDGGAPPAAGEGAAPAPAAAPHRAPASRAHGHPPLPPAEERAALPPDGGPHYNRLIHERSPYLLQHAHNPVDWYPWCEEAFARARAEDKPIFLSIGYATCHWCHVMERESFEDPNVAEFLNAHFVRSRWIGRNGRIWIGTTWRSCRRRPGKGVGLCRCFARRRANRFLVGRISRRNRGMGGPRL
ncbi:MAG: hypothetical protein KatS3mg102_2684 [Planctomycetota bacterium]|nr:MAG: hypothetical protein KatS3mg102_2684 [Planctomycetota bacterium]